MKKIAALLLLLLCLPWALWGCEAKPTDAPAATERAIPAETVPGAEASAPGRYLLNRLPALREALYRCLPLW